jgi:hypothetical protein
MNTGKNNKYGKNGKNSSKDAKKDMARDIKDTKNNPNEKLFNNKVKVPIFERRRSLVNMNVKYKVLSDELKQQMEETIASTKIILEIYKSSSFIYPDWYNFNSQNWDNDSIKKDIGFFVSSRIINEKFKDIDNYRGNIDNPFQRAIWHIASFIDLSMKSNETTMFLHLLDAFCLLSRSKTPCEFESYYKYNYNCLVKEKDYDNKKVNDIPFFIFDRYKNMKYPECLPENSLTRNNIDPKLFHKELTKAFFKNKVKIGTLSNNISDTISNNIPFSSEEKDSTNEIMNDDTKNMEKNHRGHFSKRSHVDLNSKNWRYRDGITYHLQ